MPTDAETDPGECAHCGDSLHPDDDIVTKRNAGPGGLDRYHLGCYNR